MYAAMPNTYHKLYFNTVEFEYEDLKFNHISLKKITIVLCLLYISFLSRME